MRSLAAQLRTPEAAWSSELAPRLDSVKPLLFDIDVDDLLSAVTCFRDAAASEPPDWGLDTRMVRLDRRGL